MNRRSFFRTTAGLAAAFALAPASTLEAGDEPKARTRRRVLRAAHLTDIHVTSETANLQDPPGGMAAAIRHARSSNCNCRHSWSRPRKKLVETNGNCVE